HVEKPRDLDVARPLPMTSGILSAEQRAAVAGDPSDVVVIEGRVDDPFAGPQAVNRPARPRRRPLHRDPADPIARFGNDPGPARRENCAAGDEGAADLRQRAASPPGFVILAESGYSGDADLPLALDHISAVQAGSSHGGDENTAR